MQIINVFYEFIVLFLKIDLNIEMRQFMKADQNY